MQQTATINIDFYNELLEKKLLLDGVLKNELCVVINEDTRCNKINKYVYTKDDYIKTLISTINSLKEENLDTVNELNRHMSESIKSINEYLDQIDELKKCNSKIESDNRKLNIELSNKKRSWF